MYTVQRENQAQSLAEILERTRIGRRGIQAAQAGKLSRILQRLAVATVPNDMSGPAYRLHPLKGDKAGYWGLRLTGNWRVTFRFESGKVVDVDLIDYH